nr:uncharacterized protein LOC121116170 [Lepeophtheirus salmonis]
MILSKISTSGIVLPRLLLRRAFHDQRATQNRLPQGLTMESLRRHYSLQPLFFIMGCVTIGAFSFAVRSFYINVDWTEKESLFWNYRNKQQKLRHAIPRDFTKEHIAPNYRIMSDEEGENYEMPIKNFELKRPQD